MFIMIQVSPHGRKSHSRYFILFNDMLMYCKMRCCPLKEPNSLRCCCILPLKKCTVDEILSKGMFKITCQNEVLILCSATAEEGDAWLSTLRKAVKQVSYCTDNQWREVDVVRLTVVRDKCFTSNRSVKKELCGNKKVNSNVTRIVELQLCVIKCHLQ